VAERSFQSLDDDGLRGRGDRQRNVQDGVGARGDGERLVTVAKPGAVTVSGRRRWAPGQFEFAVGVGGGVQGEGGIGGLERDIAPAMGRCWGSWTTPCTVAKTVAKAGMGKGRRRTLHDGVCRLRFYDLNQDRFKGQQQCFPEALVYVIGFHRVLQAL
jgi:hypothetical protein